MNRNETFPRDNSDKFFQVFIWEVATVIIWQDGKPVLALITNCAFLSFCFIFWSLLNRDKELGQNKRMNLIWMKKETLSRFCLLISCGPAFRLRCSQMEKKICFRYITTTAHNEFFMTPPRILSYRDTTIDLSCKSSQRQTNLFRQIWRKFQVDAGAHTRR